MAKSKKSQTKLIVLAVSALLAVLAVVFFFVLAAVNVVNSSNEVVSSYTGMQVAFGYSKTSTSLLGQTIITKVLDFSFLYFLAFLLAVLGLVLVCASIVLKKKAKLVKLVAAGLLIGAGVLFFLAVPAIMANQDGVKELYSWFGATADVNQLRAEFRESCRLGIGAILAGSLSVLAGFFACASEFVK